MIKCRVLGHIYVYIYEPKGPWELSTYDGRSLKRNGLTGLAQLEE